VQAQRARERLRAHLRVAVHVRPGPRAEGQHGPLDADVERPLELGDQLRHRVEQGRLEEEQVAAHLVLDARAGAAHVVGLPPDGEDLLDLVEQPAPAGQPRPRVVEAVEQLGQVGLVVEHGPPGRLGRVCREHELDVQVTHHPRRGGAVLEQLGRLGERLALQLARRVVLAPAPDPLTLLGDVGELQLQRERADVGLDLVVGQRAQLGDHRLAGRLVARPQVGGGVVQPRDPLGELGAPLLGEHAREGAREQLGLARDGAGVGELRRACGDGRAGHRGLGIVPGRGGRPRFACGRRGAPGRGLSRNVVG
jgi:hypothetical protein